MMRITSMKQITMLLAIMMPYATTAFQATTTTGARGKISSLGTTSFRARSNSQHQFLHKSKQNKISSTSLNMSFNLPPKKSKPSPLDDILPAIVTAVGIGVFFASPLGGIFFAITNSLFVLALLTPILLVGGFQLWKTFNAVDAACPSCGSPVTALKNGEPTMCFGCGAVLRTNREGNGVELCNSGPSFEEEAPGFFGVDTSEIFEDLFGGQRGVLAETVKTERRQEESVKKAKRESTVIDIDVIQD